MLTILGKENSIIQQFIYELRCQSIQKDRLRFRTNLERLGNIFAYEISKTMAYETKAVSTPLGNLEMNLPASHPVLCTILRAGLPLHQGLLEYFDKADNGYISAYRNPSKNDDSFEVEVDYISAPNLDGRDLIISDTMLATGTSVVKVYRGLKEFGSANSIHVVAAIASREGLEYAQDHFPSKTKFWIGAVDEEMTAKSYIVPGLGDAGDLAYGEKE